MIQSLVIKNKPDINQIEVLAGGHVCLHWDTAIGADKYIVKRSEKKDEGYKNIAELPKETTWFVDESLTHEGLYWYRITAEKARGAEKPLRKTCEERSANFSTIIPPVLTKIENNDHKSISIFFESDVGASSFDILRRYSFMKKGIKIANIPASETSYTDSNFVNGPLFYYSVAAVIEDEKGGVLFSNPSNEMASCCLDAPVVLKVKRKLKRKVELDLRLTTGADGYILFAKENENDEFLEAMRTESIDGLKLTFKGQKAQKQMYFAVSCFKNIDGEVLVGPKSDSILIKLR